MVNFKKGFTLIELLVVIAIIGILSSVVLASLNTARNKGADAATKASMNNVRAQGEVVYDNTGSYATVCADATFVKAIAAITTSAGAAPVCNNAAGAWAFQAVLKQGGYWCVDSTGSAKAEAAALGAATVCA